jgi:hypothetical protein
MLLLIEGNKMTEDAPKNIGELIEYLKTLPPETEFVTEVNVFEWKLCTWKPQIKGLVKDHSQENGLTIPYLGHNPDDVVNVIEIG